MTPQSLDAYTQGFMKKPVIGLTNLTYGEAFYLPMVEVISYLEANDFTCYIVSASDRPLTESDYRIGSTNYRQSSRPN